MSQKFCINYLSKYWDILSTQLLYLYFRRQELRELRLLQKEEHRAQQQLSNKLQQQREQIYRRFEQETTVSLCFYLCGLTTFTFPSFLFIFEGQFLRNEPLHFRFDLNVITSTRHVHLLPYQINIKNLKGNHD